MALKLKDIVDTRRENGVVVAELLECGCWVKVKASKKERRSLRRRCLTHRGEKAPSFKMLVAKARSGST